MSQAHDVIILFCNKKKYVYYLPTCIYIMVGGIFILLQEKCQPALFV